MGTIEIQIELGNGAGGGDAVASAIAAAGLSSAQQPAAISNLAYSGLVASAGLSQRNAAAHQQAMNGLGPAIVAKAANAASDPGPLQARSTVDVLTNNALAQAIADLKAAMAAFPPANGGAP